MSVCTCGHGVLAHTYQTATRANTGACLVPGCECGQTTEEER